MKRDKSTAVEKAKKAKKAEKAEKVKKALKAEKAKGIKLRKEGGGTFRTKKGRIIKPGQTFYAPWEDIPKAFRDTVRPVDPVAAAAEEEKADAVGKESKYFVQAGKPGWFDVVDADGKKQNEKALRSDKADDLLKQLS